MCRLNFIFSFCRLSNKTRVISCHLWKKYQQIMTNLWTRIQTERCQRTQRIDTACSACSIGFSILFLSSVGELSMLIIYGLSDDQWHKFRCTKVNSKSVQPESWFFFSIVNIMRILNGCVSVLMPKRLFVLFKLMCNDKSYFLFCFIFFGNEIASMENCSLTKSSMW